METFFNAVLALWAIIAGVFKIPAAEQPEGGVATTLLTNFFEDDVIVTSLVKAGKTRRRGNGDKTRAGNARALLVRTQRNAARKAASAAVATKYGHRVVELVSKVRKSLVGKSYNEVVRSIAHLGGKTAKAHGSGKKAVQCRKNTYARKGVGGIAALSCCMPAKVQAKAIVRTSRTIVTKEQRFTARGIIIWQRRAAKTTNFHAWVAAQDGGWVSTKGAAKAAALVVNTKAAAAAFTKVTGHTVTEAAAVRVAA